MNLFSEVDKFKNNLCIPGLKENAHIHMQLSLLIQRDYEEEPFTDITEETYIKDYLNGKTNRVNSVVVLNVIKELKKHFNSEDLMYKILKSYNLKLDEFLYITLNPANLGFKQDISKLFTKICELLIPNELKQIQHKTQTLLTLYNMGLFNISDVLEHPISEVELGNINSGDLIVFTEKYNGYETLVSGMVGSIGEYMEPGGTTIRRAHIMVNDMFEGGRGTHVPLKNNEFFRIDIKDIYSERFKVLYKEQLEYYKN